MAACRAVLHWPCARKGSFVQRITILGSGFAALAAVRELRRLKVEASITVISPQPALHYLPSSIWLTPGLRQAARLRIPLARFFARHGVQHVCARVTGLRLGGRLVQTDQGEVQNDQLLIATGGRFMKSLPGIEHALVPCESLAVAEQIAQRLQAMPGGTIAVGFGTNAAEPGAMRGGPMFEYLFIIDSWLRRQRRRQDFTLAFFSPSPRPGARLGEKAVDGLLAEMRKRDIQLHLGQPLVRFEANKIVTTGGVIDTDLILFMPGMTGTDWLVASGLPLSPGGMVKADSHCAVEGVPGVWVAGDVGSFPGPEWMPKQAHQADLQAVAAARNIAAVLQGRSATEKFKPELVCIVDTLGAGMLVYRSERYHLVLPALRILHWIKRGFEWYYLRALR